MYQHVHKSKNLIQLNLVCWFEPTVVLECWMCQRPVVEKKTSADRCGAVCFPDKASSTPSSSASFLNPNIQKANVLDAHFPSLKRRRLSESDYKKNYIKICPSCFFISPVMLCSWSDEQSGADGMAKICVEYESEVQGSQRRPLNLLDALERGDHSEGNSSAAFGEERVRDVLCCNSLWCQSDFLPTNLRVRSPTVFVF